MPDFSDIPIWNSGPPGEPVPAPQQMIVPREDGGTNATSVAIPAVRPYVPEQPNGHAILLCQGGGYAQVGRVSLIPEWLRDRGFHVFDLLYRLPAQGWAAGPDVTLQDAQQAIRFIRASSDEYGLTGQVGVMGFSSGGHVAGSLATRWSAPLSGTDELAPISARPDFAVLFFPVLTMLGDAAHNGSRERLFGNDRNETQLELRSVERQVSADTPPTCLIHAADDPVVSVENSLNMFLALNEAGVPVEMHIPEKGGHRMSNCFRPDNPLTGYGDLMLVWFNALLAAMADGDTQ